MPAIPTRFLFASALALSLLGVPCRAEADLPYDPAPPAEVAKKIDEAREAWRLGDKFGQQAREGLLDVKGSNEANLKLLNAQSKSYDDAEKAFSAALRLDRKHPIALETYARFLLARGRRGMSAIMFEQCLISPKAKDAYQPEERADILRTLAGLLERGGQGERAANLYRHAMELDPRDARNRISLAVCLCAQGEPEGAQQVLLPWLEKPETGARVTPTQRALGLYTYGYILEQTGRPEDAQVAYKQAREAAEKSESGDDVGVAEQAKLAARRVRAILRDLNPDPVKLAKERIGALARGFKSKNKDLAEKLDDLLEGLDAQNLAAAQTALGGYAKDYKNKDMYVSERISALLSDVSAAAEARPRYAKASLLCAQGVALKQELLQDRKGLDEAIQKYVKARGPEEEAARADPVIHKLLAAIQFFQDAIQAWAKHPRAHLELGWCKMALGEMEAAEAHFGAAALYDPLAPYILIRQAEVRFMLEDWEGSNDAFARLSRVDPEYGPAYLGLARVAGKTATNYTSLDLALDNLDRAERMGVPLAAVESVRKHLNFQVARLDRGEKIKPIPSRRRAEAAAARPADPTEGFRDIFENTFGP
ncbi:MAG: tetratricopeptide repeat protein [Planctomycetota bacterium]|nr:tetratricopeptide repeat protein [Planctomycetota bacterium]